VLSFRAGRVLPPDNAGNRSASIPIRCGSADETQKNRRTYTRARYAFLTLPYLPVNVDAEEAPISREGSRSRTPRRDERGVTRICPKMMSLNRMADATRPQPKLGATTLSGPQPPTHTPNCHSQVEGALTSFSAARQLTITQSGYSFGRNTGRNVRRLALVAHDAAS
jgi:hypothetical protein